MAELVTTSLNGNSNLKLYFRLEEASGTSVGDSSGNSSTGTASRTQILNNLGKFGNGGKFVAASSDFISVVDNSILKPTGNFSIGCWVKRASIGSQQFLLSSWAQAGGVLAGIFVDIEAGNTIRLASAKNTGSTQGTDFQQYVTSGTITDTTSWHQIVAIWDGSKLRIFLDGTEDGSGVAWANAPAYQATNYVRAGCVRDATSETLFLDGSLDDVFLFNGLALSAAQVNELYIAQAIANDYAFFM